MRNQKTNAVNEPLTIIPQTEGALGQTRKAKKSWKLMNAEVNIHLRLVQIASEILVTQSRFTGLLVTRLQSDYTKVKQNSIYT